MSSGDGLGGLEAKGEVGQQKLPEEEEEGEPEEEEGEEGGEEGDGLEGEVDGGEARGEEEVEVGDKEAEEPPEKKADGGEVDQRFVEVFSNKTADGLVGVGEEAEGMGGEPVGEGKEGFEV